VGNGNVTTDAIQHLRKRLEGSAKKQIVANMALMPAWIRPIFLEVTCYDG
jgi:hypothetical protein